jgi:ABC-type glycerol-3-phosphate transport system permease component
MRPEEAKLRDELQSRSDADLRETLGHQSPGTLAHGVISQMLHEREFWHKFWTSGIVAWLSLVLSIIALVVSAFTKR